MVSHRPEGVIYFIRRFKIKYCVHQLRAPPIADNARCIERDSGDGETKEKENQKPLIGAPILSCVLVAKSPAS
jgi:hypothetical protein